MLKKQLFLALVVMVLSFLGAAPAAPSQEDTATVHGIIYDFWDFTPMENVWIEVYSDSALRYRELHHETYALSLPPGAYVLKGKRDSGTVLIYDTEENIVLYENDNLLLDLIMFPAFEENDIPDILLPDIPSPDIEEEEVGANNWVGVGVLLGIAVAAVAVGYYISKRKPVAIITRPAKVVGLPADLQEVVDILRANGGRMNQVELRKKLPYSEAKVSLMLSDLEDRGVIRRIKRGRGNIILLTELG
jgi:uncharacterized membrane protein